VSGGRFGAANLASEVARMFFDRQLTKVEIASRLGISRFRVARLIDQALADGIVRIEFRDVPDQDRTLAGEIEERYALDLCLVAAGEPSGSTAAARLAATLVDELLAPGEAIGIAWGSTLSQVVREMPRRNDPASAVVQLAGSSSRLHAERDPGELTRVLAERLGGSHHRLYAPAFVESAELRSALARQPDVAAAIAQFDQLSMALVGIGAFGDGGPTSTSSLVSSGALEPAELDRVRALGAVGDLVVHAFDRSGAFVAPEISDRAMAISVEQLRSVPRVIAIAAGEGKTAAIRGALETGVISILVTDAAAAVGVARPRSGRPRPTAGSRP